MNNIRKHLQFGELGLAKMRKNGFRNKGQYKKNQNKPAWVSDTQ